MEQIEEAQVRANTGRVVPDGAGPDTELKTERPSTYIYFPPKEVKAMHSFIHTCTTESPMMKCLMCDEQIAPEFSFAAGFNHLNDRHPERFEIMMQRVAQTLAQKQKRCTEDHAGMTTRHGSGTSRLYCGKCGKLLYKPPKQTRSDKSVKLQNAA